MLDHDLVQAAHRGDTAAFVDLLRPHVDRLFIDREREVFALVG